MGDLERSERRIAFLIESGDEGFGREVQTNCCVPSSHNAIVLEVRKMHLRKQHNSGVLLTVFRSGLRNSVSFSAMLDADLRGKCDRRFLVSDIDRFLLHCSQKVASCARSTSVS